MNERPFASAWMKLERAQVHFEAFQDAYSAFGEELEASSQSLVSFVQHYWPRGHCIVIVAVEVQPPDPRWGVIVGDMLHNLRATLDHQPIGRRLCVAELLKAAAHDLGLGRK